MNAGLYDEIPNRPGPCTESCLDQTMPRLNESGSCYQFLWESCESYMWFIPIIFKGENWWDVSPSTIFLKPTTHALSFSNTESYTLSSLPFGSCTDLILKYPWDFGRGPTGLTCTRWKYGSGNSAHEASVYQWAPAVLHGNQARNHWCTWRSITIFTKAAKSGRARLSDARNVIIRT